MMVGALELITGAAIAQIDDGWQRLPAYVQAPVAIVGSLGFLYGLIKLLGFYDSVGPVPARAPIGPQGLPGIGYSLPNFWPGPEARWGTRA